MCAVTDPSLPPEYRPVRLCSSRLCPCSGAVTGNPRMSTPYNQSFAGGPFEFSHHKIF